MSDEQDVAADVAGVAGADWSDEHRFAVIVGIPTVRDAVGQRMAQARAPMSAEEFLARVGSVLPNLDGALQRGQQRGRALGQSLGTRTGKVRDGECSAPIGWVIADALCSLAGRAQAIQSVEQGEDGCTLVAAIPSDRKTFGGVLRIGLTRIADGRCAVHAEAEIPGQLIDWGKSKQTLADLFTDLKVDPGTGADGGKPRKLKK